MAKVWWCYGVPHGQREEQFRRAKAYNEIVVVPRGHNRSPKDASRTKHTDPLVLVALEGTGTKP